MSVDSGGRTTEILQGLEQSMPLIFFGAICFSISYVFWGHYATIDNAYYPLWLVFLIVGGITTAGGLTAALVPESEETESPESTEAFVVIEREKWDSMLREVTELKTLAQDAPRKDSRDGELESTDVERRADPPLGIPERVEPTPQSAEPSTFHGLSSLSTEEPSTGESPAGKREGTEQDSKGGQASPPAHDSKRPGKSRKRKS